MRSGQALVELAIVMPLITLLGFGSVEVVRLAEARQGIDAAAAAGAAAAARAPDLASAQSAGDSAARAAAAGYPLDRLSVSVATGAFARGAPVAVTVTGDFAPMGVAGGPGALRLTSGASAVAEPWRSR